MRLLALLCDYFIYYYVFFNLFRIICVYFTYIVIY